MRRVLRWCKYPLLAVVVLLGLSVAVLAVAVYASRPVCVDTAGRIVGSSKPNTTKAYRATVKCLRAENVLPKKGEFRYGGSQESYFRPGSEWGVWFSEGLHPVSFCNAVYYVDRDGGVQIKVAPAVAGRGFSEGLAAVATSFVSFPTKGMMSWDGTGGESAVALDERGWGFIDRSGRFVVPPSFEAAGPFSEGLAPVRIGGSFGFIDRAGSVVISPRFTYARPFSEGLAAVNIGGYFGFVDRSGAVVIAPKFLTAEPFSDGLAAASVRDAQGMTRWGYIDKSGAFVIEPQFCQVERFSDGLAAVVVWDKVKDTFRWGYIDRTGKFQLQPTYRSAGTFQDGVACVVRDSMLSRVFPGERPNRANMAFFRLVRFLMGDEESG